MSPLFYAHPTGVISYTKEEVKVFDRETQTWTRISPFKFALWEADCTIISDETARKLMAFKPVIKESMPFLEKRVVIFKPPLKAIIPFKPIGFGLSVRAPIQVERIVRYVRNLI